MTTITRERLEWLCNFSGREEMEDIDGSEIKELARIALASLEAEAVGYYRKGSDGFYFASPTEQRPGTIPLYAAPPATTCQQHYDAARAAMLQGSQPVSNRDELLPSIKPAPELDSVAKNAKLLPSKYPVIPDEVLSAIRKVARIRTDFDHFDGDRRGIADCLDEAEQELIVTINEHAAMLQGAPVRSSMPDGVVTAEHRRVIEMLLNVCGAAFELADDSCQQDVDGEECHVVPDDAFQKLSDALDEIENTLPTEDVDRPDVFLAWSAMPRAALKSILQAGNSPVIPEGYALVPIEPTAEMYNAGDRKLATKQVWDAMLAAAPQQEVK
ncbi:hypothetical protein KDV31_16795 [Citrobacter amalonaticus]|uniref:hypothetical protein n=1 Tax=Citrobacter amalonaticus TaxID=35703 RepID=UPI0033363C6B